MSGFTDSESLDTYIQNTLSSLYPPFEATAATVLWQLFSIVEKSYKGDGLRCLIDFLVPAKRVLQCIQRETCGNYTGLIFYHEGWPLCIHEKVIVQLAPLHKVRLKPGDFYFQVVPLGKQSAKLVLKCLSRHGHGMEELLVPETMYRHIFTTKFLENVNGEWKDCPLQSCLLTTGPAIYRTPWKNIVNPIFIPTAETIRKKYSSNSLPEKLISNNPDAEAMTPTMESSSSPESSTFNDTCSTVREILLADNSGNHSKDYSGLCHKPENKAEIQSSETLEPKTIFELTPALPKHNVSTPPLVKRNSAKSIAFSAGLSSPKQRGRDSLYFETKRLFRKSYIEALQNPMILGSSSEESITQEDPSENETGLGQVSDDPRVTEKTHENNVQQESCCADSHACKSNANLSPLLPCHENELLSASPGDPDHLLLNQLLDVNQELLQSGVIALCGNRDRFGRAVVQVSRKNGACLSDCSRVSELTQLLLYFYHIPRKDVRALGLLILVDARKSQNIPSLFKALAALQVSCEVLTSLKGLHRFIDGNQLTAEFDGTFPYNHNDWICFRRKLEPFITNCKEAVAFLQYSVCSLNSIPMPNTAQEVNDLMNKHKTTMKLVLEHELLVTLRLQGGTILARLRKEESCNTEDYRDAMETITKLYNQVDEEVHRLVLLSNKCLQKLENLLAMRKFEGGCDQQHSQEGLQLIKENSSLKSEEEFQVFSRYLNNITNQTKKRRSELEKLVKLYEFYETVREFLEQLSAEANYSQSAVHILQKYHQEAAKVSAENFQKATEIINALGNKEIELKQWNILWLKCQQTRQHLQEELSKVVKGSSKEGTHSTLKEIGWRSSHYLGSKSGKQYGHSSSCCSSTDDANLWNNYTFQCGSLPVATLSFLVKEDTTQSIDKSSSIKPSVSQTLTPLLNRFQRTTHVSEDLDNISTCYSEPIQASTTRHRKHPLKKIMKKTQSFELTRHESDHCELHHHGYTGVYIRGLEVASNVAAEKRNTQRSNIRSPLVSRNHSLSSPSRIHHTENEEEKKRGGSNKVNHIMDEMITTEREYVRSLGYIIDSYFPEMERDDLPQDLRGKRNIIFGNLEKLYNFHCHYFLKELEHCTDFPLRVSHCFLRHEEQFGMYALYSKNKPQSDTLLISHGNTFFKNKQQELGDKMNLASYLLKPIQRMSKYALLLKDLIKECSAGQEQELNTLRAAEEMVKFQLRHGNDLLAMDAIRGCDVNLKEQGQLRCQDEFIVYCGRKKYLRHVFLFEDLILFSKTKKIDGGYDMYMYKQSFKTAEIGMTENVGDSGLRFEIWFRRRRKSQDTYILQANSTETKVVWTNIIGKMLWRQALRNRELRIQEMVSMGIGNKPFMDIKPSDAAISDRAIDYIMRGTESRTRASIAVSSFDHSAPSKRPHSTISNSSTSSSSSQSSSSILGSLNLHVYSTPSHPSLIGPPFYHWSYDVGTCIEEDELEQDTGRPAFYWWVGPKAKSLTCQHSLV
uniref:Pleckstrin homology and RhoGEF domain containing G4B n=1 Tax=Varanus komodoensis TaxID=61221 RepID=A0A8D2JEU1_VARKO